MSDPALSMLFLAEMRVTAKELPTTKWRRERRQRTAEYQVHDAVSSDREREERDMDSPIDMSVSSGALKHQLRASPPPPYREPLPGTNYAANSRPSVITQAPPKREPPEQAQSSGKGSPSVRCNYQIEHFALQTWRCATSTSTSGDRWARTMLPCSPRSRPRRRPRPRQHQHPRPA